MMQRVYDSCCIRKHIHTSRGTETSISSSAGCLLTFFFFLQSALCVQNACFRLTPHVEYVGQLRFEIVAYTVCNVLVRANGLTFLVLSWLRRMVIRALKQYDVLCHARSMYFLSQKQK